MQFLLSGFFTQLALRFIYDASCVSSILFITEHYIICILDNLLIHSSVDRHLSCFYYLDTVNNVSMNICVKFFCAHVFLMTLRYIIVEILDHVLILTLTFRGIVRLFSKVGAPLYNPTENVWASPFSTALPTYVVSILNMGETQITLGLK